jgi:hypothetical protein
VRASAGYPRSLFSLPWLYRGSIVTQFEDQLLVNLLPLAFPSTVAPGLGRQLAAAEQEPRETEGKKRPVGPSEANEAKPLPTTLQKIVRQENFHQTLFPFHTLKNRHVDIAMATPRC